MGGWGPSLERPIDPAQRPSARTPTGTQPRGQPAEVEGEKIDDLHSGPPVHCGTLGTVSPLTDRWVKSASPSCPQGNHA